MPRLIPDQGRVGRLLSAELAVPLGAITLRLASEATANAAYFLVAAYALRGPVQAIQALALSWLFSMLSPGVAPLASLGTVGRYAVIAAAAAAVLLRRPQVKHRSDSRTLIAMTLGLGLFFVGHAVLLSSQIDVSVLKAVTWTVAMVTLIAAWSGLPPTGREHLANQLYAGLVGLLLISLPLLLTAVGYLRNGSGFQGMLGNPQVFGQTMAVLGAWTSSRLLGEPAPGWMTIGLAAVCLWLIVLSQSRTAGLAMVLSIGIAVVLQYLRSPHLALQRMPGLRSHRLQSVAFFAVIASLIAAPWVAATLSDFIGKGRTEQQANTLLDAYQDSRGNLMDMMWVNIEAKPFEGIGFGIGSDGGAMVVEHEPMFGLPVGASVEKGVMPLAVLEEVGVFGFALTTAWLWMLMSRSAARGVVPLTLSLTALLLNLAEATLFSPGGFGLLLLVLLGWAGTGKPLSGVRP